VQSPQGVSHAGAVGDPLLRRPTRPAWTPFLGEAFGHQRYGEWRPFLAFLESLQGEEGG
jgi:hypothetical protein